MLSGGSGELDTVGLRGSTGELFTFFDLLPCRDVVLASTFEYLY